ncbi:MAG: tRNA (N(6)-L-threonylcarbamoyladenosine(37)-C(2))-methylthiotransferase MtaB [Clostridiaceae bacterium]|jgi:threonylcarbamoyladenosine tRNA methylthiotransferase MtaB|nr:tRNA (N(6)-L-threonylcarbamoyladenosine(37)-C(2))-methylthiotransferase MtaB [Clostridiaceae bacterium]
MRKFCIHTMGCKANQFESAVIVENLLKSGFEEVKSSDDCDFYILNSCTVTQKSDNEALYLIRNAKHKNPEIITVLTGCLAQVEKDNLLKNDYVDIVLGNDEKLNISKYLLENETCKISDIMQRSDFTKIVLSDTTKTRANVKIQDGCDNRCSYCIIPFARGKSRSADVQFILDEINSLSKRGFNEVVLTGIHIGQWGKDFGMTLLDLLEQIEAKTTILRYRLGSLNPLEITDEMLDFLSKSKKFCPHFHLSLQSACDKTLRSMNRFYETDFYLAQIDKINQMFELPFLGSDIITGFAGETEEDFKITVENLKKSGLSKIHTFPYSRREGTVGDKSLNQVPEKVKEERANIVKAISRQKYDEFVSKNIGRQVEVLIEKHPDKNTGYLKGVTRNYLTLFLDSKEEKLLNTVSSAKIVKYENGKIFAEIK